MPYFNAPIFLQNKTQVGKIEEIFGSITVPVRFSDFLLFTAFRCSQSGQCAAILVTCSTSKDKQVTWVWASAQYFTVKMQEGVVATSYAPGDKFYIDPMKLLPMERFLPQPKGAPARGGGMRCHPLWL